MSTPTIGNANSPQVNTCSEENSAPTSTTPVQSTNNVSKPAAKTSAKPTATAGISETQDSYEANAAALDGRDSNTGIETRIFGVRGEVGAQSSVSATMARVGVSSDDGNSKAHMNVFTGQLSSGTRNADGSTGFNVSANATAIGAAPLWGRRYSPWQDGCLGV